MVAGMVMNGLATGVEGLPRRLRGKIDKSFAKPLLHTVRGAGYMIRDGAD